MASATLWDGPDKTANRITKRNVKHFIFMNTFMAVVYFFGRKCGKYIRDIDNYADGSERSLDYRTPVMFGNNDRSPLFPWKHKPYHMDFEKLLDFHRLFKIH